jgi:hypothetical protein
VKEKGYWRFFNLRALSQSDSAFNFVSYSIILELTKRIPLLQNGGQEASMARLSINSEPVQTLITGKVIPLLLASGNVASLTKALNDAAQSAGLDGRLHANRIHALLSMDASRAC